MGPVAATSDDNLNETKSVPVIVEAWDGPPQYKAVQMSYTIHSNKINNNQK